MGGSKEVNINNKKNVKFVNGNEKELIEQLSLMILSKPGTRKKREETRGSLKEQFGEKFADTLENYFKKLDNSELRNRKTSLNLISNVIIYKKHHIFDFLNKFKDPKRNFIIRGVKNGFAAGF